MNFIAKVFAICATFVLTVPIICLAQIDPPPDPIDTPIDSWLILFIIGGAIYGYFKFKKKIEVNF